MKEYTLLALASVIITLIIDAASGTYLIRRASYYLFGGIILFFKCLVNGYLTSREIVIYNPRFFMGLRTFYSGLV